MKAILVEMGVMTRIIVDDDFNVDELTDKDYEVLRKKALPRIIDALKTNAIGDSLGEIKDDEEIPFGSSSHDEYYQPSFDDLKKVAGLSSSAVFASKKIAQEAFPGVEILTYHGDDIEDPTFVDKRYS